MILILHPDAHRSGQATDLVRQLADRGLRSRWAPPAADAADCSRQRLAVLGELGPDERDRLARELKGHPAVDSVLTFPEPYVLVRREFAPDGDTVTVPLQTGDVVFGGAAVVLIAGPCAVEDEEQTVVAARAARAAGARMLRGGAFKPRTSPYSFQGLAEAGLRLLAEARAATGLGIVTEVVDPRDVALVAAYADMLQVGARNMQNFALLRELGGCDRPILLKRGPGATLEEWLMSAEYIADAGNDRIVLCERGIRTFETATRSTLDLSAVPVAKRLSRLPVIVDPSHASGDYHYVPPLARAAVAAGADGVMVEAHPHPDRALSDGLQSLNLEHLAELGRELAAVAAAVGRTLA